MRVFVFDTETSGLIDFKSAYNSEVQPHLLQMGHKLMDIQPDGSYTTLFEVGHLVASNRLGASGTVFEINPQAQEVHGIDWHTMVDYGISPENTMKTFLRYMNDADLILGHNIAFDIKIMQTFAWRAGYNPGMFEGRAKFCTLQETINICKIPKANGYGFKWPKLDEAYRLLVKPEGFGNAHNALADVNASADIFINLVKSGKIRIGGNNVLAPA